MTAEPLQRPYSYSRQPFHLGSGETIGMSGVYFAQPAYAALFDKRLFSDSSTFVPSPFFLYVNKGAALKIAIDPTPSASGYGSGCVNYRDYITDVRDVLDDVFTLHAADSPYDANDFLESHLLRRRATYGDLSLTSASGTSNTEYIHNGSEIGASGLQDIDIDEISYQPIARPTLTRNLGAFSNQFVTPFYPSVIKTNGQSVAFGPQDAVVMDAAGYGIMNSGSKLLVTGDVLIEGTKVRVYDEGTGNLPIAESDFIQVSDTAYTGTSGLIQYFERTDPVSGFFTVDGRQAIYGIPSVSNEGVYLTSISDDATDPSGLVVQFWPNTWKTVSGIIPETSGGHAGLYVSDRAIYDFGQATAGGFVGARSLINGRTMFGHFVDTESDDQGRGMDIGRIGFQFGGQIYAHIGNVRRFWESYGTRNKVYRRSVERFAVSDKTFSPVSFDDNFVDEQKQDQQLIMAWLPGDLDNGDSFGIILFYSPNYGFLDQLVTTNSPTSTEGARFDTITYENRIYNEGGVDSDGQIIWVEDPSSPTTTREEILYYPKRWSFPTPFLSKSNRGAIRGVNVGGRFHIQIQEGGTNRYGLIGKPSNFQSRFQPENLVSVAQYVVGFYPSWRLRRVISTASKQIEIPTTVGFSQSSIETAASFTEFERTDLQFIGPPIWDSENGVNYIYVRTNGSQSYFCKMDNDYRIYEAVKVTDGDAILDGPAGIVEL